MNKPSKQLLQRYLLTGAGIGLYFGLFYRPIVERGPNFFAPILFGILGGLVTAGFRVWRSRPFTFNYALRQVVISIVTFTLFLVMMEFRVVANAFGGKVAVILLTTITGIVISLALAYFQGSSGKQSPER